jgi:hypothetical protein
MKASADHRIARALPLSGLPHENSNKISNIPDENVSSWTYSASALSIRTGYSGPRSSYVFCLGSLAALDDLEFYLFAFLQAFVAFGFHCTVMHKDVRTAVVTADESISFGIVEPLHFTPKT